MILKSKWWTIAALSSVMLLSTGCAKLKSRDELNKGVQAFRNNKYADAVTHFKEAVNLDPTSQNARSYLAVSYMVQWVPGAESKDNSKNYDMAKRTFNEILEKEPTNSTALAYMASMAFQRAAAGTEEEKHAALEEARKWNERRIEVDPKDAEPYYYLGVIDWSQAYPAIKTARVEAKAKPDDPGPLKDPKLRGELKAKYGAMVDHGVEQLTKCLSIDKENEDAMSYLNLLYREKANLEDNSDAAKADVAKAEDWSNKSLDMRKIKASRPAKKTENT
ncbi:MAG: Tetratricopeptide 2 repeat protein [Bryobacterales bacterium]|jgi:tetratricopeptide (TPR) repeat protein|nr:Tetratricopeptide 2 repeat protein [Bryobacterales bacterium]